jgi:hypothetical protein
MQCAKGETEEDIIMRQARCYWGIVSLFVVAVCVLAPVAQAQEKSETLMWRLITRSDNTASVDVGDVEGHRLAVDEGSGVGIFANDEIASFSYKSTTDSVKGGGAYTAYGVYSFDDGSTIRIESKGTFGSYGVQAEARFVSGTGRFAGIKGNYSVKPVGRRGDYSVSDAVGTYTLSPR